MKKIIAIALSMLALNAFAASKKCGGVELVTEGGNVVTIKLNVPAGPMLPAFATYEIVSEGGNYAESVQAVKLMAKITAKNGPVCVTGKDFVDRAYNNYLIPSKVQ